MKIITTNTDYTVSLKHAQIGVVYELEISKELIILITPNIISKLITDSNKGCYQYLHYNITRNKIDCWITPSPDTIRLLPRNNTELIVK